MNFVDLEADASAVVTVAPNEMIIICSSRRMGKTIVMTNSSGTAAKLFMPEPTGNRNQYRARHSKKGKPHGWKSPFPRDCQPSQR